MKKKSTTLHNSSTDFTVTEHDFDNDDEDSYSTSLYARRKSLMAPPPRKSNRQHRRRRKSMPSVKESQRQNKITPSTRRKSFYNLFQPSNPKPQKQVLVEQKEVLVGPLVAATASAGQYTYQYTYYHEEEEEEDEVTTRKRRPIRDFFARRKGRRHSSRHCVEDTNDELLSAFAIGQALALSR